MGFINFRIEDEKLHKKFKIVCIREGTSMQDVLNKFIKGYVKGNNFEISEKV